MRQRIGATKKKNRCARHENTWVGGQEDRETRGHMDLNGWKNFGKVVVGSDGCQTPWCSQTPPPHGTRVRILHVKVGVPTLARRYVPLPRHRRHLGQPWWQWCMCKWENHSANWEKGWKLGERGVRACVCGFFFFFLFSVLGWVGHTRTHTHTVVISFFCFAVQP